MLSPCPEIALTISANYPSPVQVNGFTCRNCTDVDYAKKHIDPAHPKAGPYGIDAKNDPSLANKPGAADKPSVSFGGSLSTPSQAGASTPIRVGPGSQLNLSV
jgi:hypothetical protein